MRVLIDGAGFQLASEGMDRVWVPLLAELARRPELTLMMLDRGKAPVIAGTRLVPFPSYTMTNTAADSLLIQHFCHRLGIDVFTSTHYTTPTTTSQVQLVHDLIPEMLGVDLDARPWRERALALSYASHIACASKTTQTDLMRYYPKIEPWRTGVVRPGVNSKIFNTAASDQLPAIRQAHALHRPYLLLVGSREQVPVSTFGKLLFDAARIDRAANYDIVTVGDGKPVDASWMQGLPGSVNVKTLNLSDAELASAYTGALAFVYASPCEGFGLPIAEAMACGCPVITAAYGPLREVAGEAALLISGHDPMELRVELGRVCQPDLREQLIAAGLKQAAKFGWGVSADTFIDLMAAARLRLGDGREVDFHRRWHKLRAIQANVDLGLPL